MYRCNRVVCDRRHAGVHHVQHGDALYVQGEKGRSQKSAGAGAGSFEHVHVQQPVYRVSAQYLQVSYISTSKGNVAQYAAVLNYDTDYGSVPFAISIEPTKVQTTITPWNYTFTRYQVTSDKGTKRWIFIFNDDTVSYDLKDTEKLEYYSLPKDWVTTYYKN